MRTVTFQKLIDAGLLQIGDGYRAKLAELGGSGFPFLRAEFVDHRYISFETAECFHKELASKLASKLSRAGDTVITTKGNSTGCAAYVQRDVRTFVYSPHLSFWRSLDTDKLNPDFLREWAHSPEFIDQLNGMKDSTDMAPYMSLTDQRRLRISLPEPTDQRSIAHVLGVLDDKIASNRRMNRTLEEMAAALFRSWFVDFDPVVRNAEKKTGAQKVPSLGKSQTAPFQALDKLFPDAFQDSELGPIPKGWREGLLSDEIDLAYGKALKEEDRQTGEIPVYGSNGQVGWHNRCLASGPGIIVGRKGNAGTVTWSPDDFFAIDTTFYVIRTDQQYGWHFLFHSLQQQDFEALTADSAVPGLNRNVALHNSMVLPPHNVAAHFENVVDPWWRQIAHNVRESQTLAALRDTLLPKLLSGEVRVKNMEAAFKNTLSQAKGSS